MSDWNATLYRQFERERTRPAADLLVQAAEALADQNPASVVDLGCGPGNSTELLLRRFPGARITGVDLSPDMIADARRRLPECRFLAADIGTWEPDEPVDLVFANASLQWVPEHERLLPRLLAFLRPGGVLAVQMPDNREEPSHASMRAAAAEEPWSAFIGEAAATRVRILDLSRYYDLLGGSGAAVELWRTIYQHPMPSAAAIVTWVRATGLRPFLDRLPAEHHAGFLARYEALLDRAYPPRADGQRLLAFPRLFMVARRP